MPSRGMNKLRQVEKIGLVVLCIVMLVGLGLGSSMTCGERSALDQLGSFVIAGERIPVSLNDRNEFRSFLFLQNQIFGGPPPWKFATSGTFGFQIDPDFREYQADEKDLWTFMVLDRLAQRAGIVVPRETVQDWIRDFPLFWDRETRKYSRAQYDKIVNSPVFREWWPTGKEFHRMVERYLAVKFLVSLYNPLLQPTKKQVYDTWKVRNRRHDFQYVAQPFGGIRTEIDSASFTSDEIAKFYEDSTVRRGFNIPAKRSFEAIYLNPSEISEERFAAIRNLPDPSDATRKLVEFPDTDVLEFYKQNKHLFPKADLIARLEKEEEEAKEEESGGGDEDAPDRDAPDEDAPDGGGMDEDGDGEDGDGEDGDGEDGDGEDGDGEEAEEDAPAAGETEDMPADGEDAPAGDAAVRDEALARLKTESLRSRIEKMADSELLETYFRAEVEKELVVQRVLERLRSDAAIDSPELKALAEGVDLPWYRTEKPLGEYEVGRNEPVGGPDLRLALNRFGKAKEGEYAGKVVRIGSGDKRGWAFFRVNEVFPAHYPELADVLPVDKLKDLIWNVAAVHGVSFPEIDELKHPREIVLMGFPDAVIPPDKESFTVEDILRLMYRARQAEKDAIARLVRVREAVKSGNQTLAGAAQEKGFEVRDIRGATKAMRVTRPEMPEGEDARTDEQRAADRLQDEKWLLVKGYMASRTSNLDRIRAARAGNFLDPIQDDQGILTDPRTDAAYLVYIVAHGTPGPEEMPDLESRTIYNELTNDNRRKGLRMFFEWDQIVNRYQLDAGDLTKPPEESQ